MKLPLYQVDAFEEGPFTGNPAAVVPLEEPMDDVLMQRIAEENNLSETAFTAPIPDGDAPAPSFALRWFTPTTEVDLCGHATLAAAAALRDLDALRGASQVHFSTRSGPLVAHLEGSEEVSIDLPTALPEAAPGPEQLDAIERALDAPVESVFLHRYALAILPSEDDVRGRGDLDVVAAALHEARRAVVVLVQRRVVGGPEAVGRSAGEDVLEARRAHRLRSLGGPEPVAVDGLLGLQAVGGVLERVPHPRREQ